jgi:hypothetical protein
MRLRARVCDAAASERAEPASSGMTSITIEAYQ